MVIKTPHKRVLFVRSLARLLLGGAVLVLAIFSLWVKSPAQQANAATAGTINFQARLMGSAGQLVADGNYHVEFKLYNASSSSGSSQGSCTGDAACLWTETRTTGNLVTVKNGYLTVNLGSVTPFPATIKWDQDLWLTMNIGGSAGTATWDGEMSPRLKLTAVPYAFRAGQLAKLTGANTSTLDFATQTAARSILLPDENGTLCIQSSTSCGFASSSGSGNYIQNGTAIQANANFAIQSAAAGSVGGVIRGAASQTADLTQWQNSAGTTLTSIKSGGVLSILPGVATTNSITLFDSSYGIGMDGANLALWGINSQGVAIRQDSNSGAILGLFRGSTVPEPTFSVLAAQTGQAAMRIRAIASQTADLLQLQNSASAVLSKFDASGNLSVGTATSPTGGVATFNGNVGIGTTSPAYKLDVVGDARFGASGWLTAIDTGSGNGRLAVTNIGTVDFGNAFLFRNNAGTTEYARITSAGNVGIGTTNPQQALTLGSARNFAVEMATPAAPTVTPTGTTGTTSYSYTVTALDGVGETVASTATTTTTGNATLSATNYNAISWTAITGASSYSVYRTASGGTPATTGKIGTVTTTSLNDTGLAASGTSPTSTTAYVNKLSASGNSYLLGGNVGVGTASPQSKLTVSNGTQAALLDPSAVTGWAGVWLGLSSIVPSASNYNLLSDGLQTILNRPTGGDIFFRENNVTQMVIKTGTGNVGINTISPTQKLEVYNGNVQASIGNLSATTVANPGAPTVAVNATAGNLSGTYYYVVTFVTPNGQSAYGTVSAAVSPAAQQVDLSAIPTGTAGVVTARKIYRTTAGGASTGPFYLVTTLNDNTTTTYTDNIADASLGVAASNIDTSGGMLQVNGTSVLKVTTNSTFNTALGLSVLNANTTGDYNTGVGYQSLLNNTTGRFNTGLGKGTLQANTTGQQNIAIGVDALKSNTTANNNVAIGAYSLQSNTTGYYNIGIGTSTLQQNTTGFNNFALGASALYTNTTGYNNTAIGVSALQFNTTGYNNIALGVGALQSNTTGYYNTAIGPNALLSNSSGFYNTAIGSNALQANTTGNNNVALGSSALYFNTTGVSNTAIGGSTLYANTTGNYNTALGESALQQNSTGTQNTALGKNALFANTTGNNNTGVGYQSLQANTTGTGNTGVGMSALLNNSGGNYNVAQGIQALYSNTTGSNNTALGLSVLFSNTTGGNNVALGYLAGYTSVGANANTTGSNNTFIGYQSGPGTSTQLTNATAIGNLAVVSASNSLVLGSINGVNGATSSVNVGIGTATPAYPLDVAGDVNVGAANAYRIGGTAVCTSSGCTAASGSGSYIQNGTAIQANANFAIQSAAAGSVGGVIRGAASQTADLLQVQNSAGTVLSSFDASGTLRLTSNGYGVHYNDGASQTGRIVANLNGDSAAVGVLVKGGAGQTGDLLQLQDSTGANLQRTDAAGNQESIGYYNNGVGGIGQFQNLLTYSEQLDNAAWTATNITVTANDAGSNPAPDSQTTAEKLVSAASGTATLVQTYTTATNGNYTYSVYVKTNSGTQPIQLRIDSTGATPTTGTAASFTATTTWQRFSVTQNFTGTPSNIKPTLIITNTSATVAAWGAQLVTGTSPKVYARSTASTIAANVGVVSNGGAFISSNAAADIPLVVQGAPSQSGDLLQVQNSAGTVLSKIDAGGRFRSDVVGMGISTGGNTDVSFDYPGTGNAFLWTASTGNLTVKAGGSGVQPFTVKGASGQTADLLQVQNSAASVLAKFNSGGALILPNTGTNFISLGGTGVNIPFGGLELTSGAIYLQTAAAGTVGQVIKGFTGQTANLLDLQDSTGIRVAFINAGGGAELDRNGTNGVGLGGLGIQANTSLAVGTTSASRVGILVKGATTQAADLLQLQNSAGTVLSKFDAGGNLSVGTGTSPTGGVAYFNGNVGVKTQAPTASLEITHGSNTTNALKVVTNFNSSTGGTQLGANFVVNNASTSVANTATSWATTVNDSTTLANILQGMSSTINDTGSGAKTLMAGIFDTSGSTNTAAWQQTLFVKGKSTIGGNILQVDNNIGTVLSVNSTGAATFTNSSNSTTAFQVQNSAGTSFLTADSTNKIITSYDHNVGTTFTPRLFSDSFESGNFVFWESVTTAGTGTAAVDCTVSRGGRCSAKFVEANSGNKAFALASLNSGSTVYARGYFQVTSASTPATYGNLLMLWNSTAGDVASELDLARNNSTGALCFASSTQTGSVAPVCSATTLPLNTWARLELKVTLASGTNNSSYQIFKDGTSILSGTFTTGTVTSMDKLYLGDYNGGASTPAWTMYADDLSVDTISTNDSANLYVADSLRVAGTASLGKINVGANVLGTKFMVNKPATGDWLAQAIFSAPSADKKPLVVQGAASQTADLLQLQNNAGTVLSKFGYDASLLVKPSANTTTAFQVQNTTATSLFTIDTTNNAILFNADLVQQGNFISGLGDSGSLVPNSGFEMHYNASTPNVPDGWQCTVAGTASCNITNTSPAQGNNSATLQANTGTNSVHLDSKCIPITGGRTYNLYVTAKSDVATTSGFYARLLTFTTRANCSAGTGSPISYDSASNVAVGTTYVDKGGSVTPATTQLWAQVQIYNYQPNVNSTFTVDAVRLIPSSLAVGIDIAENFPARTSDNLQPGELLSFGPEALAGGAYAVRSGAAYDSKTFGVVSTRPGFILDDGNGYSKVSVALAGRVPLRVNLENGPIAIGDPITASSTPGIGMKAVKAGRIIGYADSSYDGSQTAAEITLFINPSIWVPQTGNTLQAGTAVFDALQVNGSILTASLNVSGAATINNLTVTGNLSVSGVLTVKSIVVGTLTVNGHVLSSSTTAPAIVKGTAAGRDALVSVEGTDTAGTITIKVKAHQPTAQEASSGLAPEVLTQGELTTLTFHTPFELAPRVVITPTNDQAVGLPVYVVKTNDGFKLVIKQAATDGAQYRFDYIVVGAQPAPNL